MHSHLFITEKEEEEEEEEEEEKEEEEDVKDKKKTFSGLFESACCVEHCPRKRCVKKQHKVSHLAGEVAVFKVICMPFSDQSPASKEPSLSE